MLSSNVPAQIGLLLESVNETNFDLIFQELCQFTHYGAEGSILMLKACLGHLYSQMKEKEWRNKQLEPLLLSIFKFIMDKPNFSMVFCQSIRSMEVNQEMLEKLSNVLNLSVPEKILIGLALCESNNVDAKLCANKFCMDQIEELLANPVSINCIKEIQSIILFLENSESLSKHVSHFSNILSLKQPNDLFLLMPFHLDELLGDDFLRKEDALYSCKNDEFDALLNEMEEEMSVGDILTELGYGSTFDTLHCKEILSLFTPLTELTITKILGTIVKTHTGMEDRRSTFATFGLALGRNISTDLPLLNSWDIGVLINSINQLAPDICWARVFENLDNDGFYVPDEDAFSFLMSIYRFACQDPFPIHAVCGSPWKNTIGQLSFLKYAVISPPDVFSFAHSQRQLALTEAERGQKLRVGHSNHAWLCLDLLDVLCQLAEMGHFKHVRLMLDYPLEHCPEILLLGLSHVNTAYHLLQHEVCLIVFPVVIKSAVGCGVLHYLWHANPDLLVWGMVNSGHCESHIFDIFQEEKILSHLLDVLPSTYGIRLAALASTKGFVDLEKWLNNNLVTYKGSFFEECVKFVKEIHLGSSKDSFDSYHANVFKLYMDSACVFLKVLDAHAGPFSSMKVSEEVERLRPLIVDSNPRLPSSGSANASAVDLQLDDVEAEANSYFHQMFSGQISVEAMVQTLARFKESSEKREQSIFDCMIGNLFEEHKFFPKYPERQLKIAAVLFGSVIRHQLVTHLPLGIALRYVLDALRKPPDSKMFVFGARALEQFVDRLVEWPQYCNHILQISHLRGSHSELVVAIERALARISGGHLEPDATNNPTVTLQLGPSHSTTPPSEELESLVVMRDAQVSMKASVQQKPENNLTDHHIASPSLNDLKILASSVGPSSVIPSGDAPSSQKAPSKSAIGASSVLSSCSGFVRPSRGVTSTRFGSALNIETLIAAAERREIPIEAPTSEIQDKISFIINNISATNIDPKATEFAELLKEPYYPWFAQYMVMKRASIEPNFHDLYLKFLDKINTKGLTKEIVQATYENCKVLLGSELIKSSSEERSLLKNLGSWLGKLTIGKNQVLRAREIDPKSLIVEAYEKGLMIAVIPFTSKVLEPCQSSLAYQPPNPWTMGILGLLAEIYSMPNLKMNLKFDIEVLFKNLAVDVKDIMPTSLLRDRRREVDGNPDFSNKDAGASQTQLVADVKSATMPPLNHGDLPLPLEVANPPISGVHAHLLSQYASPAHLSSRNVMEGEKLTAFGLSDQLPSVHGLFQAAALQSSFPLPLSELQATVPNASTHCIVNQNISSWGLQSHFQRVIPIAIDRAIKDTVSSIVQRSVSVATQTTKELVLKDYAMELDETRIYNAAHLMVASLSGSLAHATCKDPLRSSLATQLRNLLQGLAFGSEILENAVQLATNDNLDLCCAIIEHSATEKALETIDGEISQQLSVRRKQREAVGATIFDAGVRLHSSIGALPEPLRPRPGHLSISQQRVYEDFVRIPWQNQTGAGSHGGQPCSTSSGLMSGRIGLEQPGNVGLDAASRTLDLSSETVEPNPAAIGPSSIHIGQTVRDLQQVPQNFEGGSASGLFFSTSATPELQLDTSIDAKKESGGLLHSLPSATSELLGSKFGESSLSAKDAIDKYQIIANKIEALVTTDAEEVEIQGLISEIHETIIRCVSHDEAALAVAQKAFMGLFDNSSNSLLSNAYLAILVGIRDVYTFLSNELTRWITFLDDGRRFNKDIIVCLMRYGLIDLADYDLHVAKLIDGGVNKVAVEFVISLLQTLVVGDPKVISELHGVVDVLAKLAMKPGSLESLRQLIEIIRNPAANATLFRDKRVVTQSGANREEYSGVESMEQDPVGFREQASILFADWYRICELSGAVEVVSSQFILQLYNRGLLNGDDMTDRFFRILLEISVSHSLSVEVNTSSLFQTSQQAQNMPFLAIDIFARLVYSILKVEQGSNKLFLLSKILTMTLKFIQKDSEEKKSTFNPRPYFRLFLNWLLDLTTLDPIINGLNFQLLTTFANAFHALQPLRVPGFSFVWLDLVSHRSFMPKLITRNIPKGWPFMQRLLVDLFQFLEPFLRNAELALPIQFLYKGTLKVLLVLLHDFPEFLCDYHFAFCDVIPPSCIQMRNIVLSAFPRNMRLPDPSTPNLKIDLLPEIRESPHVLSEVDTSIKAAHLKADLDEYLNVQVGPHDSPFLAELKQRVLLPPSEVANAGTRYNIPLINSLVLYAGIHAIRDMQGKSQVTMETEPIPVPLVDASFHIYHTLITELDTEGRYLLINAIANQLRYPNNHTHYFSFVLLHLFAESNQEIIQEQITRVLLERLVVNRPHPWGLLITFIELIKNPRYNFWGRSFRHCAPEIEKLFDSVARSCSGFKPIDESMVSGWISESAH